MKIREIKN